MEKERTDQLEAQAKELKGSFYGKGRNPWRAYVESFGSTLQRGDGGIRFDAGETAMFISSLEATLARSFDRQYPELKAMQFVPVNTDVDPGAETIRVEGYDGLGAATLLQTYGEDVRNVDLYAKKASIPVIGVAASWLISLQQMRAASMSGRPVNEKGLNMARYMVLRAVDELIARGDANCGMTGFTNCSDITPTVVTTGGWATATTDQIVVDVMDLHSAVTANGVFTPDTLLLPTSLYAILVSRPRSAGSDMSIVQYLLNAIPGLTTIEPWARLETADAAGTDARVIMYQKIPEVCEAYLPVPLEALPPFVEPLKTTTVMHARCGGTYFSNPTGAAYSDNCD